FSFCVDILQIIFINKVNHISTLPKGNITGAVITASAVVERIFRFSECNKVNHVCTLPEGNTTNSNSSSLTNFIHK
ncbi:MAG TPA: hypothetical protein PLE74_08355, partial [Candidatus Cloacimonadota bacterium]|nr:hypothetical protein [Candidatus Cloacimonadota bacterium]